MKGQSTRHWKITHMPCFCFLYFTDGKMQNLNEVWYILDISLYHSDTFFTTVSTIVYSCLTFHCQHIFSSFSNT